jgi:hypothetical protein
MLMNLVITDLTQYHLFVYYPVREIGDDCVEAIKEGSTADAKFFSVYGVKFDETEDAIADFTTIGESAGYCLTLNASLQGRTLEIIKNGDKIEKDQ